MAFTSLGDTVVVARKSIFALGFSWIAARIRVHQQKRATMVLLTLDDALLADVGLTRSAVIKALRTGRFTDLDQQRYVASRQKGL